MSSDEGQFSGVITFTVESIVEDPINAVELMRRVQIHPLWEFFVRPAVLGAAAHTIFKYMDDWQYVIYLFSLYVSLKGLVRIEELLELMNDGAMSLLKAPTSTPEARAARFVWYFSEKLSKMHAVLENCPDERPASKAEMDSVDETTAQELLNLQLQHPGFCQDCHRFVLVTGAKGLNIDTVREHTECDASIYPECISQLLETKTTYDFIPQFPDYLEATGFALTNIEDSDSDSE